MIRLLSTVLPNCTLGLIVFGYSAGFVGALKSFVRFPPLILVQVATPFVWVAKREESENDSVQDSDQVRNDALLFRKGI